MAEIVIVPGPMTSSAVAAVGDRIRLELPENPTTGYRWQFAPAPGASLTPVSDDYHAAAGGVGGGGRRVFAFIAAAPGVISLRLELKRAWESAPARETLDISLSVR